MIKAGKAWALVLPVAFASLAPLGLACPVGAQASGQRPVGASDGEPVLRHNPVFGVGPQTIWDGGLGPGVEVEVTRFRNPDSGEIEEEVGLHAHLDYGITQDLTVRVALPLLRSRSRRVLVPGPDRAERDATGVGDLMLRGKYRFWHRFSGSTQYHAAVVGGVKVPLASATSDPPLGTGAADFLGGATISRDGLRYYLWASALARVNGEAFGRKRGNQYRYDAAVGLRPWIPDYTSVDPLFLLELNGLTAAPSVIDGLEWTTTGGTILALAPAFWLTRRNVALKGGVKLPVYRNLGPDEPELDYTIVLEIEMHF